MDTYKIHGIISYEVVIECVWENVENQSFLFDLESGGGSRKTSPVILNKIVRYIDAFSE